jgi:diaminopimelate epimerase
MPISEYHFHKYQALGNDMLVIDPAAFPTPLTPQLVRDICHRHFGVGADGICYGPLPRSRPLLEMQFFNPDGSRSEKSGNGLRIFARYLWDAGYAKGRHFEIGINGQKVEAWIEDDSATTITTTLGRLSFPDLTLRSLYEIIEPLLADPASDPQFQMSAVNIGNPHCVLFLDTISPELVRRIGPVLETADPFPNRTNVQLLQVLDNHTIQIEIWERGAGYTLASGTSASASAGAAIQSGRCQSPVEVHMAGGKAHVIVDEQWQVKLTGQVEAVYRGMFP